MGEEGGGEGAREGGGGEGSQAKYYKNAQNFVLFQEGSGPAAWSCGPLNTLPSPLSFFFIFWARPEGRPKDKEKKERGEGMGEEGGGGGGQRGAKQNITKMHSILSFFRREMVLRHGPVAH